MRTLSRLLSASLLLPSVVPVAAQTAATIEEPKQDWVWFRVDPATGALFPLEVTWTKPDRSGNSYYCYLPGASSPVAFRQDEPHTFVMRVAGMKTPPKRPDGPQPSGFKLGWLSAGDKGRYATKQFVPMDEVTYGPVVPTVDRKNKTTFSYTVLHTPRQTLPPGEYALSGMGLSSPAGFTSEKASAFRITEAAAPAASRPAQPSASAQTQPSAPDLRQIRAAAERGDATAQSAMGYAYAGGAGVPQDYAKALEWFNKAATQGSADAQYGLGVMYRDGLGVQADAAQQVLFFGRAAEQGHPAAQANLGNLYFLGQGVLQDYVEAHKWLNLGSARLTGDLQKRSVTLRDQVAAQMTPAQVAEAQKRASQWNEAFERRRR